MTTGTKETLGKVLVIESDPERTRALCSRLRFLNYDPVSADDSPDALEQIDDSIAVMLGSMPTGDGHARRIRAIRNATPVLRLPEANAARRSAPELTGAHIWALDAPLRRSQLEHLLKKASRYKGRERRGRITGSSASIREVRTRIEQVAAFGTTVLVTGESGTGKELVACTVHDLSERCDGPFVPVNCGAIPPELLESELFGHEKGAFTGALATRKGRFELAEGGTLFLDEIGDMSLEMQAKLLRVLQERSFERVGSNRSRRCDVRIVAATHRDLKSAVAAGEFREDLYYRLNVFPIEMPPLRKRSSDLPALLDELLVQHAGPGKGRLRLSPDALAALAAYSWPGNVRELSNLVERLAILYPEGEIGLDSLPEKYREFAGSTAATPADGDDALDPGGVTLKEHLGNIERRLIEEALAASGGVVAQAARLLKLRRTTLVEKLGKYGIETAA